MGVLRAGDDRSVSPVIGTILLVGIMVVLMSVIAVFVLGGGPVQGSPDAEFVIEQADDPFSNATTIVVRQTGGLAEGDVEIRLNGESTTPNFDNDTRALERGDTLTLDSSPIGGQDEVRVGDVVHIIYVGPGGSESLLEEYTVGNPPEPEGPNFVVEIDSTNSPITEGENLQVAVSVENDGDLNGTQHIELEIDGEGVVDDESVSLGAYQTTTIDLVWEDADSGDHTAIVSSDNDTDEEDVEVTAIEPDFQATIDETNSPIEEGSELEVDVTVENVGQEAGTQDIVLTIAGIGDVDEDEAVSLDDGQTHSTTLVWDTTGVADGEYDATVSSDDDVDSKPVRITDLKVAVVGDDTDHTDPIVQALTDNLGSEYAVAHEYPADVTGSNASDAADEYDVFVVNNFGDETDWAASQLYDHVDDETGIVSLENLWAGSDAISTRESVDVMDDPDWADAAHDGDSPIQFELQVDHPIFDGVGGQGDTVDVYQATEGHRAWFGGFDGDVLADVDTVDEQGGGSGVGITTDGNEVLLSLGYTGSVLGYDNAGETILANSVDFLVEYQEPDFQVSIDDTNSPVEAGETLEVTVTVENQGSIAGTQDVVLDVDGERDRIEDVTLGIGEDDELILEWETESGDGGEYTAEVSSEDDADSIEVEIESTVVNVGIIDEHTGTNYGDQIKTHLNLPEDEYNVDVGVHSTDAGYGDYDVYVVQFIWDSDNAAAFMDRTSGSDIGVVYLDQYQYGDGPANGVLRYTENSDALSRDEESYYYEDGGIGYFTEHGDHEILGNDFEEGYVYIIYNDNWQERSWFTIHHTFSPVTSVGVWDYDAELWYQDDVGLAVDDSSNTVLAASLGLNDEIADSTTSSYSQFLRNTVEYVEPDS